MAFHVSKQLGPVWEGSKSQSNCDCEQEWPSDGEHPQGQLSITGTSTSIYLCQPVPSTDQVDFHLQMHSYSVGMDREG